MGLLPVYRHPEKPRRSGEEDPWQRSGGSSRASLFARSCLTVSSSCRSADLLVFARHIQIPVAGEPRVTEVEVSGGRRSVRAGRSVSMMWWLGTFCLTIRLADTQPPVLKAGKFEVSTPRHKEGVVTVPKSLVVLRVASLAVILTLAPFTVNRRGGVQVVQACAQSGLCCEQANSICSVEGQNHVGYCYSGVGKCSTGPAPCW